MTGLRPTHPRILIAAVLAVALTCLVAAAGAAAVKRPATTSTLVFKSPNNFSGDLSSPNLKCLGARIVTLLYLGPGGMSPPTFVEAAKTDGGGHFEINTVPEAVAGNYQITIEKRRIRKHGKTLLVCQPFASVQYTF
jgi:hypothetical protein